MANNFTPRAQQALALAKKEAQHLHHSYIGTEHLLIGLIKIGQGLALKVLQKIGIDVSNLHDELVEGLKPGVSDKKPGNNIPITPRLKKVLIIADKEAKKMQTFIGTEHLLLGILKEGDGVAANALKTAGASYEEINRLILKEVDPDFESKQELVTEGESKPQPSRKDTSKKKSPTLKQYGRDLTELAENNELDSVVGREEEIDRVIQILCRRTKNNPILIGEAGVGKTAIAEGLAQQIAHKNVPSVLLNKRVISLDLALLVAGTMYRGQFEERITLLLNEIKKDGNVILFIDEIHMMVGAGSASGSMDASNIFKPALSRGEMQIVGATTLTEYRKYIEKDAALERRFQQVKVEAPSIEQTIEILKGIRPKYEQHHNAVFLDTALEAAAKLSERYLSNRFLPDKAIDLIDEAGSRARMDSRVASPDFKHFEISVAELDKQKREAIASQKFEEAAILRDHERSVQREWKEAIEKWNNDKQEKSVTVNEDQVMKVLAKWTGIPLTKMEQKEAAKLLAMEQELGEKVIGQNEAVVAISKAMRRARANIKDPNRPIGSFLFLGPTGVGKTYLTQVLAELMFGSKEFIIQIDMSEYMEKFSVSRLIGAPPGYVGYEEGGQLTEQVRRKPYSLVLFDEVEKAHPDALHLLLQILEEGKVTDSLGRKIDFRNTIIIMTSNVGAAVAKKQTSLGFGAKIDAESDHEAAKEKINAEAKQHFKPELLNRLDGIIVFRSLDKPELIKIVDLEARKIIKRLTEQQITLTLDESAKELLIEKGYDPVYGARPLRRAVEQYVEDPIAEEILKETFKTNDVVVAKRDGDKIVFEAAVPFVEEKSTKKRKPKQ